MSNMTDHAAAAELEDLRVRVGHLTRELHESLKQLGVVPTLSDVAQQLPDAKSRLRYIAEVAERSATRVLDSIDALQPQAQAMRDEADVLLQQLQNGGDAWRTTMAAFLLKVQANCESSLAHYHEMLMAQEFQDLTGQVVKRTETIVTSLEKQLVQLLVDTAGGDFQRKEEALEGPQVEAGKSGTVANQGEVDDLLASLGF